MTKIAQHNENIEISGSLIINDGTQGVGKVLTTDSGGTSSWQVATGSGGTGTYITGGTYSNGQECVTTNLITNGGFTGGINGWGISGSSVYPPSGWYYSADSVSFYGVINTNVTSYLEQDITTALTPTATVYDISVTVSNYVSGSGFPLLVNLVIAGFEAALLSISGNGTYNVSTPAIDNSLSTQLRFGSSSPLSIPNIPPDVRWTIDNVAMTNTACNGPEVSTLTLTNNTGGTFTVTGFTTGTTIANTVFVSKNGNDSIGKVERLDKPFLTIAAARSALLSYYVGGNAPTSTNRKVITVFSGYYTEPIILDSYVDYDLNNSTIDVQSGSTYTIDDYGIACDSFIYGNAILMRSTSGIGGIIRTQNSSSYLNLKCDTISTGNVNLNATNILCTNGTQIIETNTIDTSNNGLQFAAGCGNGYQKITFKTNYLYSGFECSGGTQLIYGNPNAFYGVAVHCTDGIQNIYGNVIQSGSHGATCIGGVQNIYGDIGLITGGYGIICLGGLQVINNSRISTDVDIDVVISDSSGTTILNSCILSTSGAGKSIADNSTVKIYGDCQANASVGAGVTLEVGTLTIT